MPNGYRRWRKKRADRPRYRGAGWRGCSLLALLWKSRATPWFHAAMYLYRSRNHRSFRQGDNRHGWDWDDDQHHCLKAGGARYYPNTLYNGLTLLFSIRLLLTSSDGDVINTDGYFSDGEMWLRYSSKSSPLHFKSKLISSSQLVLHSASFTGAMGPKRLAFVYIWLPVWRSFHWCMAIGS